MSVSISTINVPFHGKKLTVGRFPYTFPVRGLKTSYKRSKPTPSVLDFLCLSFSDRICGHVPNNVGRATNTTPERGISPRSLVAVLSLPTPIFLVDILKKIQGVRHD